LSINPRYMPALPLLLSILNQHLQPQQLLSAFNSLIPHSSFYPIHLHQPNPPSR
jgi:hypothetical protein